MDAFTSDDAGDQLSGWKDIAAYLGKSVRTVQRWEHLYHLPIYRLPGSADVVVASKHEIEQWKRRETPAHIETDDAVVALPDRPIPAPRLRPRARILLGAALLVAALATLALLVRNAADRVAPRDDRDATVFDGPRFDLRWNAMEGRREIQHLPGDLVIDPGFASVESGAIVFTYRKQGGAGRARPYIFALLGARADNPRLRFTYVPHSDARISHFVGFMTDAGFVRKGEESLGYFVPRDGIALRLDRGHKAYVNSRVGLWLFSAGEPRALLSERRLDFQFDPGRRYDCTIGIEGWRIIATIDDGTRVETLEATMDSNPPPVQAAFIADAHDGVSASAPPGEYRMRFENVSVRDMRYRVEAHVVSGATRTASSVSLRACPVAIRSNPWVDATAIDQNSLRAGPMRALAGTSPQGFACRQADADGDGLLDLLCDMGPGPDGPSGPDDRVLEGRTLYGRLIRGRLNGNCGR